MTTYDEAWAAAEEAKRKWMAENSLYTEELRAFVLWCRTGCLD